MRCFISAAINLAGNAIGAAQQNANTDKMIAAQKAENEAARQWNSAEAQKIEIGRKICGICPTNIILCLLNVLERKRLE